MKRTTEPPDSLEMARQAMHPKSSEYYAAILENLDERFGVKNETIHIHALQGSGWRRERSGQC